jgi:hypothetical protein
MLSEESGLAAYGMNWPNERKRQYEVDVLKVMSLSLEDRRLCWSMARRAFRRHGLNITGADNLQGNPRRWSPVVLAAVAEAARVI